MLGIKYIKFDAMTYVMLYKNGKIKKEGKGLSFFYTAYNSTIVAIPMGSNDIQFIFKETTNDYQTITIQGLITYQIENPKALAEFLDFTVDANGKLIKEDIEKLHQRMINAAQTATSSYIQSVDLKKAISSALHIENEITNGLRISEAVQILGVKPLSVNVVAVKPTPEMGKALETTTREALQQEADQAIYQRRNFAVEQERKIKESEMNTEIAVQEKQKQISMKKMEGKFLMEENERKLREMKINGEIATEEQRKKLVLLESENRKKVAETEKYILEAKLEPYKTMDWKTLFAIGKNGASPSANIALAFREMAENAEKINQLQITPDLLQNLANQSFE